MGLVRSGAAEPKAGGGRLEGNWVIERHAVLLAKNSALREAGFSRMQERVALSESPCRVVSAPTGSGKSFVFGMLAAGAVSGIREEGEGGVPGASLGKRVFFVSPTVRLVESLRKDTRGFLEWKLREWAKKSGISFQEGEIESMSSRFAISISGAQAKAEALAGKSWGEIISERFRRIRGKGVCQGIGEIVFVTPEIFAAFAMGKKSAGATEVGIVSMLSDFDHIVFDEVHALAETGMGLPLATMSIAAKMASAGSRVAKVSLLSATVPNVAKAIQAMEMDGALPDGTPMVDVIAEALGPDGERALHGDVEVRFAKKGSLPDLAMDWADAIREEIHPESRAGSDREEPSRQVVMIFDRLSDLHESMASGAMARLYARCDLLAKDVIVVNSGDDRNTSEAAIGCNGEMAGRSSEMGNAKLVVATSSVEAGVTFRGCRMILMDTGFGSSSLCQRVGRCARGDIPGRVVVRIPENASKEGFEWLRKGIRRLGEPGPIGVEDFARSFASASLAGAEGELPVFGELGIGRACLWILAAQRKLRAAGLSNLPAHKPLDAIRTGMMSRIHGLAKELEDWRDGKGGRIPGDMRKGLQEWLDGFWDRAKGLRDFDETVIVKDAAGERPFALGYLERAAPKALSRGLLEFGDSGWSLSLPGERLESFVGERIASRKPQSIRAKNPFGGADFELEKFCADKFSALEDALLAAAERSSSPPIGKRIADGISKLSRAAGVIPSGEEREMGGDLIL